MYRMGTKPPKSKTKSARYRPLFLEERMAELGLSDEKLAERLGVARETVTRYRTQQHRLNPEKMAKLAKALDCEPEELWRSPARPSIDARLKHESDEVVRKAAEAIALILAVRQ